MLRDLRIFRRNSAKNPPVEANNENLDPSDSSKAHPHTNSSGAPLNTIQEPSLNPKMVSDKETAPSRKTERNPSRNSQISGQDAALRTPEKSGGAAAGARNKFGWAMKNESGSIVSEAGDEIGNHGTGMCHLPPLGRGASAGVGGGFGFTTPHTYRTAGRASSVHSDTSSTQSTPTKSVNKPPNPRLSGSRPSLGVGARAGSFATASRGIPISSVPPSVVNTVEVPHFELKEDPSFWMDHNVQVVVRIRPLNSLERILQGYSRCLKQESAQSIAWIGQPETRFTFDHVACETINQETLFRVAGLPMVENCMSGYNSCMFAYGQTGSGKTYTMLGEIDELDVRPSTDRGMTPRIFEFLFARIRAEEESRRDEKLRYNCKCSFLEIYNEQITDLLEPSSTNLLLREDIQKGVYVENLSEFEVETVNDILKLLIQGAANRKVAATNMNRESSRSHSVFTCVIESRWEKDSTTNLRFARLNLVDLAGSERQKTSGAEGERLKEAANINKSLSTLGHVIMILVDVAHGKQRHVPYRDSRLTFLLQDSLGGNSKTMIIANVSPSICCASETLSTMKFAQRAKLIQNNAVVNEDASGDIVALQHQIRLLKEELSVLKRHNVSRSLSFRTAIFRDSDCEGCDNPLVERVPELSQGNGADFHGYEASASVRVSTKQLKSLETTLAGALRREKMTDIAVKQLEAEIEQLNRLVRQREEDTRCTKMMLKFREDKIHRMELLVDGLMPTDSYLLEEKNSLAEEIQLLRARVDRNPEVTRFALENIRLLDQLRRFQDFYEEGERELLLAEVSELRDQLVQFLEGKFELDKDRSLNLEPQELVHVGFANSTRERDTLHIELKKTSQELEDCRINLKSCLENNAKLTREIDDLHTELSNLKSLCDVNVEPEDMELCSGFSSTDDQIQEKKVQQMDYTNAKHAEEILNLQLELDILKTILGEDRLSSAELEERASHVNNKLIMAEERVLEISKHYEDAKNELRDARSIIEALESHHILLISEMEELRDSNKLNIELLRKQDVEISILKKHPITQLEDVEKHSFMPQQLKDQPLKHSENEDSPLQAKLKRMQASLEKARILNIRYQSDRESQNSHEQEMEEVRRQVEAETAEVIVCLEEELATLQRRVEDSNRNEVEAKRNLTELEIEMKDVQERLYLVTQDNKRLGELIEVKDEELRSLTEEWERLAYEIAEVLADGNTAIEDASNQVDSIVDSFPQRVWVGDQVGRMVRTISEKDALIEELQNCLEDAQKIRCDMEWKLRSLRGATLAITEAQQQENCDKEREIIQLTSQLSEKMSIISKLENNIQLGEDQIRKAEVVATAAFMTVNRISEIHAALLEELEDKELQVNNSEVMHLQKDAILHDQVSINADLDKQIQALQLHLEESEENVTRLQLKLAEDQEQVRAMECQLEKIKEEIAVSGTADNLLTTKEKLNEFKMGVSTLYSCMNEYAEQSEGLAKEHIPGEHDIASAEDDSEDRTNVESTQHINNNELHDFHAVTDYSIVRAVGKNANGSSQCNVKSYTSEQEQLGIGCGRILKDVYDRERTILLLRKEMESALDSLKGVQDQMGKLLHEKEEIKKLEIQSRKSIEHLTAQVLRMEKDIIDKEKQFELRMLEVDHKMKTAEGKAKESIACWNEAKQELETEVSDAKAIAAQKTTEASIILVKFEDAQETMREADVMVNALVAANESAKLEIQQCLKIETMLTCERDNLASEVQDLHSSLDMKKEEYVQLKKRFYSNLSDLTELSSLVLSLENIFGEVQTAFTEELKLITCDIHHLKSQLLHSTDLVRTWLEDIWSEIIGKDCAVSVLHLCHMGVMLETITGLNAENGFLHYGLCESNTVIADLRAHNVRAKKELKMCSILKGKLLVDINNSFSRITRKEDETGEFKAKLSSLEKKILDLQLQEESMLARSNMMGTELAVLMKEFDINNRNSLEEWYLKDFELLILTSELKQKSIELKQMAVQKFDLERETYVFSIFIEKMKEEMVLLMIDCEVEKQILTDMEIDTDVLMKEVREAHIQLEIANHDSLDILLQLKQSNERIKELEIEMKTFECDLHHATVKEQELKDQISRQQTNLEEKHMELKEFEQSNEMTTEELKLKNLEMQILIEKMDGMITENAALKVELREAAEAKGRVFTQFQLIQNEKDRIIKDLMLKEAALESSSNGLSVLGQQNQKLQDDICFLQASMSKLQSELERKNAELTDSQHSSFIMVKDLEWERTEMATLISKLNALQAENEKLKNEVSKLNTEHSKAIECFQQEGMELGSSSSSILDLNQDNHDLLDIICSLKACISSLQTDLDMKKSELEEVRCSHSVISKELNFKSQDHEIYIEKTTALKLENESLRNEVLSVTQKEDEALALLSLSHKQCSDSVQSVNMILNRAVHIIEGNNITLMDKMFQEICEYKENISEFIANFESLELSARELLSDNLSLQSEFIRKDEVSKGLLFDLSLLQESASIAKDQKDELEEMAVTLESLEDELASKSSELDEAVAHGQMLKAQLLEKINMISCLELELAKESESLKLVSSENLGLKARVEDIVMMKKSVEEELAEKSELLERLEMELLEMRTSLDQKKHFLEGSKNDVTKLANERDHLESTVLGLKEQLEMAHALAEENEAIATEARQIAESKKVYAEEKEEEVKLLERSIEELECTVNVLENKVEIVKGEAGRQRLQREELEMELQVVRHQMLAVQTSSTVQNLIEGGYANFLRHSEEKVSELQDAQKKIEILRKDVADKDAEIVQCKAHILELNMHAEAQARENNQKIKELEAMAHQVKNESSSSHAASLTSNKPEKTAVKSRGSGSPFKCIGLGLTQQINSEKDEELTAGRVRIEELEALAASRQKEIFMLNARLAKAESMTHDVIRDLLGVKLDITNYASLLDQQQIQKIAETACLQSEESQAKEQEVTKLKQQLNEFIEERQGWLDEISRRHTEMVAARIASEKLWQREQFLTTENEMLKADNVKHKKMVLELEDEVKKLSGRQNLQQRIHHHAKIKEENNMLKIQNEDLTAKLRRSEEVLSRVKEELACFRSSSGKNPYRDIDEEQRLKNQLETTEEERIQLAQKLLSLCTSILKTAGITRPTSEISPPVAEEALNQLEDRLNSLECELQDVSFKSKISEEKIRLSELRQRSSPLCLRTNENCRPSSRRSISLSPNRITSR